MTNPGSAVCPGFGSIPILTSVWHRSVTIKIQVKLRKERMSGGCQVGLVVISAPPSMAVRTQRGFPCKKMLPSTSGAALWSMDQQLQVAANFGRALGPWRRPGSDSEALWGSVVLLSWFCCDLATCFSLCGKAGAGLPSRAAGSPRIPAIPRDPFGCCIAQVDVAEPCR